MNTLHLRFDDAAHQVRVAKLLGLIDPAETKLPKAGVIPDFTPTQQMLDAQGLTATPEVKAILGKPFRLLLQLIDVEWWKPEGGTEDDPKVPVHYRVNIGTKKTDPQLVAFLKTALGKLVITDDTLTEQGSNITRWS